MAPKTVVIVAALMLLCSMHFASGAPVASQQEPASSSPGDDNAPSSSPTTSATTTTETTTQLNVRTQPTSRPPPSTDNPKVQPDQVDRGTLREIAERTKRSALEATQAAVFMNRYLLTQYLSSSSPSAMPPCFIEERDPGQLNGNLNPAVNYQQQLKEDYESLEWYNSYWDYVEQKNSTDTNSGYQTGFMTVRSRNNLLLDRMATLFEAANITIPQCTVSGDEAGEEGGEGLSLFPEHCYNTSYEQQARIYLRYLTLTRQYIPTDIDGVLQQKAGN